MRLIIAGSRTFNDYALLSRAMKPILEKNSDITIISGTARGADELGERYAYEHKLKLELYPANWNKYGKAAGYKRNFQMAKKATHLLAFWDGLSRGTKHMIDIATTEGLRIHVIHFGEQFENITF